MNKNLFRIIFNKRRGQLMAVAETSASQGKAASGETRGTASGQVLCAGVPLSMRLVVGLGAISLAVLGAIGAVVLLMPNPAHAQVVAYRDAPGNQQPTVLQTANGVPQINIQTPSAAGVSRNTYSQFDVQSDGAVLNNSRTNVQTRLGGWVQGNPWLATGSARVILNEVNSTNPSYLNGYVEVAGQRAEVVIANPSGISVNGAGFINTSKATLTTGAPIFNNGSLDGYRVQAGNISINGNGLDLTSTDYAAILARAVQVNAGIWANELMVITGANQIDASSLSTNTTPITASIAGTGAVPSFALDVAQIGGMYAGKIHLIGTEQGLGVRSAGSIGSTGGDLVLQNNGWLTTTGTLQASADLQINTQGNITNSGTLYASNDQTLHATGHVTNNGLIAAQGNTTITANSLSSNAASVMGAGVKTDGHLANQGNLSITTSQALIANGQNLAAGNITLGGSSVDLSASQTGAANIVISATSGNVNISHATVTTSGSSGVLAISARTGPNQTLDNTQGVLSAGQLNFNVANLNNTQGQITQTGVGDTSIVLTAPTGTFNNTEGTVTVNSANLNITANALNNTDGKVQHAGTGTLRMTAGTFDNVRGQTVSNHNVELTVATQLDNTHGLLEATTGSLNLSVASLNNAQGSVYAAGDMHLAASGAITNSGFIAAQGNTTLSANSLSSSSSSVLGAGIQANGSLANSGDLKITTTQGLVASGQNLAAGNMTLSGSSINLSDSQTGATNIAITATAGDVQTTNATVAATETFNITAKTNHNQTLNNTRGVVSAGQLNLDVANLNNTQGQLTQTGTGDTLLALTSPTSTFNNTNGTLATNSANFSLSANTLTNTDGKIQHAGTGRLALIADTFSNGRGQLVSNKNASLQLANLDNTQGSIYASGNLELAATGAMTNTGFIAAQGNTTLSANSLSSSSSSVLGAGIQANGSLANSGDLKITTTQGLVASGQNLAAGNMTLSGSSINLSDSQTGATNIAITATAGDVNTTNATLAATETLNITAKANHNQTFNNTQGVVSAGQLNLDVANLNNTQGQLTQTGTGDNLLALTSPTSTFNNTNGTLATNSANFSLSANTLTNTDGKIQHAGTGRLALIADTFSNGRGQLVSNKNASLQLANLDNTQGSIYASGNLELAATGAMTNTGFIAAQGNTTLSANSLSSSSSSVLGAGIQANGTLANSGDLKITTTQGLVATGQNLAAGNITLSGGSINLSGSQTSAARMGITATAGDLNVSNATVVATNGSLSLVSQALDNTDGQLQATGNLNVTADALTNARGQIASNHDMSMQIASLDNAQGSVYAAGDMHLAASGAITNSGFMAAQGNTTLSANSLSSSSSSVLGAGIQANGSLANSGDLKITTTQGLVATGQNLAAGNTTFSGSSIDLSGSQTGATRIAITATAGDVNTTNATLAATETLNITAKANHNQTLNNTRGVVSAGQLNLDVANLNNTQGQLTQTGTGDTIVALTSPTSTFNNTNGTLATNSANFSLSANTLTNTDGKIQHAGTGTLHITAHTLNDQQGQLVSNNALVIDAGAIEHRSASTVAKNITLTAISLDNNQGQLVQTGNGSMAVSVAQGLDNTAGTLGSNGHLSVVAQSLTNRQGQVSAIGDLSVDLNTTTGALSNLQGVVAAKGHVAVTAASVDNTLGTLASVDKNLSITTAGATNNDSGIIQAGLDITLANTGLSNTRTTHALATGTTPYGSIQGRNIDINTNTQTLNNAGGTLVASQSASFQTGTFNNNAGLIQTGKDLVINTHNQTLTNTYAANYTSSTAALNGKGGMAAQGTTTLTTGDLNNDAGYIGSKGALTANSANISNTLNGQIQGLDNLTLTAGNGITTGTINNTGGLIRSAAITRLSAGTVTNSNTSGPNLGIEGLDVCVSATTLRNDSGAIRADQNITLTSAGTVDNSAGLMSAGNTLTLQDVQAQSSRTLAITNTNATLLAGQSLAVAAKSIGGDGRILSKGNINLVLNADLVNSGEVIANGNATLSTLGNVTNSGKLQAGQTLNLTANNIDNTVVGEISGNTTQVNANSTLTNRGLIDGVDTQINANTVNNIGTGRLYGDHLSIAAVNLTNDTETIAGETKAGTIAARDRLDLGVSGTLTNREHALIYSVGDMAIGGALDANHRANGLATEVNNDSATVEAGGHLTLSATTLNNRDRHFTTALEVKSTADVIEYQGSGAVNKYLKDTPGVYTYSDESLHLHTPEKNYETWTMYDVTRTISETTVKTSDASKIMAGGRISLNGDTVFNDNSQIIAGDALSANVVTLTNSQTEGVHVVNDTGISTLYWRNHQSGRDSTGSRRSAYNPADQTTSIYVSETRYEQFTLPTSTATQVASLSNGSVADALSSAGAATTRTDSMASTQVSVTASSATQVNAATGSRMNTQANNSGYVTGGGISAPSSANQLGATQVNAATGSPVASGTSGMPSLAAPVDRVPAVSSTDSTPSTSAPMVVRTTNANTTLPNSSLYKTNPSTTTGYLVETDPRFTNNKTWLGSDYMTQTLSLDPTVTQKRLGDGFYEQKLIREQVAQLTGRRYLGNYTSDEQEYQVLMNNAITYAQTYHLRPGIALTAQQVAQLTSDIVWLVEQTVTLPDGTTQKVLVPQLYVKVQPGDLDGSGTLLAGKDVNLNLSGDLTNSGTIAGRNVVSLTADNVNNLGGRISGDTVEVAALRDLNNLGGSIDAISSLGATAGRDLNVQTTTRSAANAQSTHTGIDRVAGLYVSGANGVLVASAGRDLNLTGAVVSNAGSGTTALMAGNNLNLSTVKTEQSHNLVWDTKNRRSDSQSADVGSQISGGGAVNLQAGQTLSATAANVQATGALSVNAKNILIQAGQSMQSVDEAHQHTSKGFLSSKTTTTRDTINTSTAVASNFGGSTVTLNAQKDILIRGSNVISDGVAGATGAATTLSAGNNVTIEAAINTSTSSNFNQTSKSGLMSGGGLSVSYGKQKQSVDSKDTTTTAAASTVGSINGGVSIQAGNQYKQVGSDVVTPGGDINITAKQVDIVEARETNKQSTEQKFEQSGVTVAVTSTVLSTLQNAQNQIKATTQTSDDRMKALGAASAAANVKMAADALKAGQGDENGMVKGADGKMVQGNAADKAGGISVSLSYGTSSSQSKQTSQSDTARGSSVKAGGGVTIQATGDGQNSNLTLQGSEVSGKTVNLEADNQVNLLAASNTSTQTSSNSSRSASVGIAAQLGNGGAGIGFTGSVSKGKGSGNGTENSYTNTHVAGTDQVTIKSGGDTTLKGATVEGKQVTTNVGTNPSGSGGNLNIESLQDTATYSEKNQQVGASGMIGAGMSGSVNFAKSNIHSNYASVTEQSGIKAGDGGFQVNVQGSTDLKGGAITSTQAAIDQNKNGFQTGGTLTTSDIQNKADYKATSVSVSASAGSSPLPGQGLSSVLSGAGMGKDSGSAASTTTAGISGVAGDTAKRTGDNAQGIGKIFDADKVRQEIQAQTQITQEFGKQASTLVQSYSQTQRKELQDQIKTASETDKATLQKQLDDVNTQERVLNILVGAVTGLGASAAAKESLAAAADEMRTLMIKDSSTFAGVVDATDKTLSNNEKGLSEGIKGDGVKLGGTRVDLDLLCGPDNVRCTFEKKVDGSIDTSKPVTFKGPDVTKPDGTIGPQTLAEFLATDDGIKMAGPTGGVQGYKGTLFGTPYEAGSWQDKLIESFAGTHDMIGGKLSGLYDDQGNIKRGMSDTERAVYNYGVTTTAILPSIPFAAAQGLPPEVWNAISILLKAAK